MKALKTNKDQPTFKTPKQHKHHKTQIWQGDHFHKPHASPSPDKKRSNQICETTAPCQEIQDFMNQHKRLKPCVEIDQLRASLYKYNHSYDAQVYYHQNLNEKRTRNSQKNKKHMAQQRQSSHKLEKAKNMQSSTTKAIKDKISQIKYSSSYNKSWSNNKTSFGLSSFKNSRKVNDNSYSQSQEQEIRYLKRELQKYRQYIEQYEQLANKNKHLQQTMQQILLELQQNKRNSSVKDPLPDIYRTQDSVQFQDEEESERTLDQKDYDNINRKIQQYEDQIDELIAQNKKLTHQRQFFQRKFIQLQTRKDSVNKSKLELQTLANSLSYDFQIRLTKYDHELQQKIQSLQQKFSSALEVINDQKQNINSLERENLQKKVQNQQLKKYIEQYYKKQLQQSEKAFKQSDKDYVSEKEYRQSFKKRSSQSSLNSIKSKSSQKAVAIDKKFRQILQMNIVGITQALTGKNTIPEHPSQYDQDQAYQKDQLEKNQSYVLYKSSDFKKKNQFLQSLGVQTNQAKLLQYNSEKSIQAMKLQHNQKSLYQPEQQNSNKKLRDRFFSFGDQQVKKNSQDVFIYIEDQEQLEPEQKTSKNGFMFGQIQQTVNPNKKSKIQNFYSSKFNIKDSSSIGSSYENAEFSQILRENLQMKNQLQKIDEQYRLQLAINEQISSNIRKLEQQLEKMQKQRNSYVGSDQQRVCQSKKAFNQIKDQIHTLDYQLQQHYKHLGNCLQSPHSGLNSKDIRINDLQQDKKYLISQVSGLKETIASLRAKVQDKSIESTLDKRNQSPQKRRSCTPINPFSQIKDEQSLDDKYQQTQKRILSTFQAIDLQKAHLI